MKPAGSGPVVTQGSESAAVPLRPPLPWPWPWPCPADVRLCGHLRKEKSQSRRFFVLRADPPRLECYESEKQFRACCGGHARPRRTVSLAGACTISKRGDARQRHLIVLYTRDNSLGVAAASEVEQQAWYSALLEVRAAAASGPSSQDDPEARILAPFQDVWPVTLQAKGLGRARGLGSGSYRLCLGSGSLSLLRKSGGRGSRDARAPLPPALRLSLLSVRRCGHADSFFFLELGRSAPTGPGELWLQAPDAEIAQSIHETVLAAMKSLGGSGRAELPPRERDNSTPTPPAPQSYETPASEPQPRGLVERIEQAALKTLARLGVAATYPKGLDPDGGRDGSMGARGDYVQMGSGEAGGYMEMVPPSLCSPASDVPHQPLQDSGVTEYVHMKSFPPRPVCYKSKAGEPGPRLRGTHQAVRDSWEAPLSELAGEYVRIEFAAPDSVGLGAARVQPSDSCLNYIDLDLVHRLEARGHAPGAGPHSYARIKF